MKLLLVFLIAFVQASDMACKTTFPGASYDLSKLASMQTSFSVQDRIQTNELNYLYTFGICKAVPAPSNCKNADGTSRVRYDSAPAWQTRVDESSTTTDSSKLTCKYLGSPDAAAHSFSQINAEDPAAGVTLKYTGGQHCSNGLRRTFALNMKCAPKTVEKIEKLVIDESAHCEYEIGIESEYACPTECGLVATGAVCAAHGLCGYDSTVKKSLCFCNTGRTGAYCTDAVEEESSQLGPILGLLIFVVIALVGVVALLIAMWRYIQGRGLGDVYTSLNDNFTIEDRRDSFDQDSSDLLRVELEQVEQAGEFRANGGLSSPSQLQGASQL